MKFGIKLANCERLPLRDGVGRVAVAAEKFGYESVWVSDHIIIPGDHTLDEEHKAAVEFADKQQCDALISLAYVAGMTSRIKLGTAVLVLPLRNPLLTAKMVASLDALSGGRVILGTGAGWLEEEFGRMSAPAFGARGKVTDEWISILRSCWTQETVSHHGAHYSFDAVHFSPRPQRPIPIWVGGNSPAALRRAGRLGDGWLGSRVSAQDIPSSIAKIKAAAETGGRDPSQLVFAMGIETDILAPGASRTVKGLIGAADRGLIGTADEIVEKLKTLEKAGINHLELRFRTMRDDSITTAEPTLACMQQFSEFVMPCFGGT